MMRWALILGVLALAAGGVMAGRKWVIHRRGERYLPLFNKAEQQNNLPPGLLARVAEKESSFLPDVIAGLRKSPAGAVGIMQIVPRWHPGVDPTDPVASIDYAGKYLRTLYNQTGTWRLALAAYNWGIGNLRKWQKGQIKSWPRETLDYVDSIAGDLGL